MRFLIVLLPLLLTGTNAFAKPEWRAGWFSNPTPANMWLNDADGEWTIGVQGGYQAEWLTQVDLSANEDQWVKTNGYYGYGCARMLVDVDKRSMRILKIYRGKQLPLRVCLEDPNLPRLN